jgi:hypothetical protein
LYVGKVRHLARETALRSAQFAPLLSMLLMLKTVSPRRVIVYED